MKKTLIILCLFLCAVCAFSGCAREVNYSDYISEKRSDIFVYEDDGITVKIYCAEKEQPYAADGIKGDMCPIMEIFVTLPKNPQKVDVSVEGLGGEMNYRAVENCFYLSFTSKPFEKDTVDVTLTYDGESNTYPALSVKYDGVMTCEQAVLCAVDFNGGLFEGMSSGGLFDGEIYVRLLYDEGCYYYVGVINKQKHISAFLIDGERGKVITTKELDV